jgi:hypothetical protein
MAAILSNLGEETVVTVVDGLEVHFWSLEPFRTGAFWSDTFDGEPIMTNQWDPFTYWFDGVSYHASWRPWAHECHALQVDADAHDFAGKGYLIDYTFRSCGVSAGPPLTPRTPPTAAPEPSLGLLVLLALIAFWRHR